MAFRYAFKRQTHSDSDTKDRTNIIFSFVRIYHGVNLGIQYIYTITMIADDG